jgi:PhnB protein
MTVLNSYLSFEGNCEEAFNFYKSVFGGEFSYLERYSKMSEQSGMKISPEDKEKIIHISLPLSRETLLMGSDVLASKITAGNNVSLSITTGSKDDADRYFRKLSEGGKITMPMNDTFWGDYFGMLIDKYGINWMIGFNEKLNEGNPAS